MLQYRDLYEQQKLWQQMTYRGWEVWKTPEDMWLYQEVIHELGPSVIVEFGSGRGGSGLFFADMLEVCVGGLSIVLSMDIDERDERPEHDRLHFFTGHSRDESTVNWVHKTVAAYGGPVLIIEDSLHSAEQIRGELSLYHDLVTPGSYFVIEDGGWPDQPREIQIEIDEFLESHTDFHRDASKWKYNLTMAPDGWLRRDG